MLKPNVKSFFDDNTSTWTYVVYLEESKSCAIIDSVLNFDLFSCKTNTASADQVVEFVQANNLNTEWILETHAHADHLTAAQYLKEKLGGKIAISKSILGVLETWQPILENKADTPLDGSQFDKLFEEGEPFKIGALEAKVFNMPGHTPADACYVIGDAIFVGDVIFMPDVGSGRCDFPGGNAEDSYDSSRKLFDYPKDFRVYTGHDYPPEINNKKREPECMATVEEQFKSNIRLNSKISKEQFTTKRRLDDQNKQVPKLLLPSIQFNLRAGSFGKKTGESYFIKLPINAL